MKLHKCKLCGSIGKNVHGTVYCTNENDPSGECPLKSGEGFAPEEWQKLMASQEKSVDEVIKEIEDVMLYEYGYYYDLTSTRIPSIIERANWPPQEKGEDSRFQNVDEVIAEIENVLLYEYGEVYDLASTRILSIIERANFPKQNEGDK